MKISEGDSLGVHWVISQLKEFCFSNENGETLNSENLFLTEEKDILELYNALKSLKIIYETGEILCLSFFPLVSLFEKVKHPKVRFEWEEIAAFYRLVHGAIEAQNFYQKALETVILSEEEKEKLDFYFDYKEVQPLYEKFSRTLTQEGALRSDIPELIAAEKKIHSSRQNLLVAARSCFSHYDGEVFSSQNETIRGGRVVLAVKSNFSYKVKGIVHESSASGGTLFVEPLELVELNNRFMEAQNEKNSVLLAIFKQLSQLIFDNASLLEHIHYKIKKLDFLQARLRFHLKYKTSFIEISSEISLWSLIHPQLGEEAVALNPGVCRRCVVISGPNAGGKSVLLKSIGLAVFCHQSGLGVFAHEKSTLPLFKRLLCDIGDRQSINEALSTYSAHLHRMKGILEVADKDSLVLLDEFASGTDPLEGGALALSLLKTLLKQGASVFLTTHNGIIKERALLFPEYSAFAMAFDTQKMKPSYTVLLDSAGDSHAIDIAASMNLPAAVLDEARLFLKKEIPEAAQLMSELLSRRQQLALKERAFQEAQNKFKEEQRELSLREISHRSEVYRLKKEQKASLANEVRALRKEVQQLAKKEMAVSEEKRVELENHISHFEKKAQRLQGEAEKYEAILQQQQSYQFKEGDEVLIGSSRQQGRLVRTAGKGRWLVEVGSLRMTVKEAELTPALKNSQNNGSPSYYFQSQSSTTISPQLDIRGMMGDEAIELLESYLDQAILKGLGTFSVIHGTGEGILQRRVHDFLRHHWAIEQYAFARPECGGFGKTEVKLK